jgi:hypothetical protein
LLEPVPPCFQLAQPNTLPDPPGCSFSTLAQVTYRKSAQQVSSRLETQPALWLSLRSLQGLNATQYMTGWAPWHLGPTWIAQLSWAKYVARLHKLVTVATGRLVVVIPQPELLNSSQEASHTYLCCRNRSNKRHAWSPNQPDPKLMASAQLVLMTWAAWAGVGWRPVSLLT